MAEFAVTLVTCGNREDAEKIAGTLVKEKLAACVNVVPGVTSIYVWEEKLCREEEVLLIIKSRVGLQEEMFQRIRTLHRYSVPEMITLPITAGYTEYLNWVRERTS